VSTLTTDAFRIHADDNVATLLGDAEPGALIVVRGDGAVIEATASQAVASGHKIALYDVAEGERLTKYGFPIGEATRPIAIGEWVHLHNCRSMYDPGSSELDVESGARNETRYA